MQQDPKTTGLVHANGYWSCSSVLNLHRLRACSIACRICRMPAQRLCNILTTTSFFMGLATGMQICAAPHHVTKHLRRHPLPPTAPAPIQPWCW